MTDADRINQLESQLATARTSLEFLMHHCEELDKNWEAVHSYAMDLLRTTLGLTENATACNMAEEIRRLKRMEECR